MALPSGVTVNDLGRKEFVTQRGYFAPPYVSCMFAALGSILIWMGYEIPLHRDAAYVPPDNFVWTLHKRSGAPLDSGSSVSHTKTAMSRLLPDAPMYYGGATSAEIITLLTNGAAVRVTARCGNLPLYLRKWVGDYTGGHAFCIIGTRMNAGVREVFWMDPMGKPWLYQGQWIPWSDVSSDLDVNGNGKIIVTYAYKDTAVDPDPQTPVDPDPEPEPDPDVDPVEPDPEPIPDPVVDEGEDPGELGGVVNQQRAYVAAGAHALHAETLAPLFQFKAQTAVRVFGQTPDGMYYGVVARSTGIDGTNPKVVLVAAEVVSGFFTQS